MLTRCFGPDTCVDAARARVARVFDLRWKGELNDIIISVSGGKDSTVLAWLALQEAHRRGEKVGVFFLDEEVMYQSTIEQVEWLMTLHPENTTRMWLQVPFNLTNATSLTQAALRCWEPGESKRWMRRRQEYAITHKPWPSESETIRNKNIGLDFYDVIANFERTHHRAAFLVGLRGQESPNRWRAVTKNPVTIGDERIFWGSPKGENWTLYPLYDWDFRDVWRFIHENRIRYSRIYDMMFRKGYPLREMRVSSLIHERSFKSICDLAEFEPDTYEKLRRRIKGIALAQETARDARLFRARKLPQAFKTWRCYRDHLLETYPDASKTAIFAARFARQKQNEFVARQQVRQLVCNDYENNVPVKNDDDPRDTLIRYYEEVL